MQAITSRRHLQGVALIVALFFLFIAFSAHAEQAPLSEPLVLEVGAAPGQPDALRRLDCQAAIEEVYWQQRLWPASNDAPRPPLSEVISDAAMAAKVENSLAQSAALEQLWRQPITGPMLQAEIERMAAQTQRPAVLAQVWAALDNDPGRIAECLARPLLAERLLRQWQQGDARFGDRSFAAWWRETASTIEPAVEVPAFDYALPPITGQPATDDTWTDTAAIPWANVYGDLLGDAVWTGAEMIYLEVHSTQGYRYDPATDMWQTMTTVDAITNRREYSAVWTGTEVVFWGGCSANNHRCTLGNGKRYNPATDTWIPMANAPFARTRHDAVWTGSEMIVWGGCTYSNDFCTVFSQQGGRYDPQTDSWQLMSTTNAPNGQNFPPLIWTGSELIFWSGADRGGGRYDPASDTWQPMSTVNAPAGYTPSLVWTGSEAIAFGGCTGSPQCNTPATEAGRYDPATDTWSPLNTDGMPAARFYHDAVWTGSRMMIWGGTDSNDFKADGALYDPATDTWSPVSGAGAPSGRHTHDMIWTGDLVLVWGGVNAGDTRQGGRYDPATNSWTPMNAEDPDTVRRDHTAVWTGAEMIVWGGAGDDSASIGVNTGRIFDPITNSWSETSMAGAPSRRFRHTAVWTGSEMIVWGGSNTSIIAAGTGGRYNPATDTWTPTSTAGAPLELNLHSAIWTGSEMIVWGGSEAGSGLTNSGGRYDPATDTWRTVSVAGAPGGRYLHSAVWTGSEMLIWGGSNFSGVTGDGARYDPALDSWTPITTTGAPSARMLHGTVWSGSEMIVWGGAADSSPWTLLDDGARYDPGADAWTPISAAGAPERRARHSAVWTGDEMIVWSGCQEGTNCLFSNYTGGRYDPFTDSWQAMTMDGVPEAREYHTAIWTGSEMIVFGGQGTSNGYRNTGGRYGAATSGNAAPVAVGDAFQLPEHGALDVTAPGVLSNDHDPEGATLTAILVSGPTRGNVTLNEDGSFHYTADEPGRGDAFTYRVSDGERLGNTATVTLEPHVYEIYLPLISTP